MLELVKYYSWCGFNPGILFFIVYINNLPGGITTNAKHCTDDTALFSVINDYTA